jgi:DNA-binding response OmpR family regulator
MMREPIVAPRASRVVIGSDREAETAVLAHWSVSTGHECRLCKTGDDFLQSVRRQGVVLAIVDATFADGAGLELVCAARERGYSGSILFIADEDRSSSFDTVVDTGVTDFIRRPIDLDELLARVRAATRHNSGVYIRALECGPIRVELARNIAFARGGRMELEPAQYRILVFLIERHGAVIDRDEIQRDVLGARGNGRAVDVHISGIRAELKRHGCDGLIQTIRGRGYRFRLPEAIDEPAAAKR